MHPADIQAELKKRYVTQREIAAELGVSPVHVSEVIRGMSINERVMARVAEIIDRPADQVFPEHYHYPKRRKKRASPSAA